MPNAFIFHSRRHLNDFSHHHAHAGDALRLLHGHPNKPKSKILGKLTTDN